MNRTELAARNNAFWCDAVCRAHGGDTMLTEHVWFNRVTSPPFYPNVDTLTKDGRSSANFPRIAARRLRKWRGVGHREITGIRGAWAFESLVIQSLVV
jgi:hypothetical protein